MKTRVTVLAAEPRTFPAKEGRPANTIWTGQCVVNYSDGSVAVGVVKVPERLIPGYVEGQPCKLEAGEYMFEYGLAISWDKKELGGVLKCIEPLQIGKNVAPAPSSAAASKA